MSETAPEAPAQEPTEQPEEAQPEAAAQETDWKSEARKWETLAKKHKSAAEKLAEIEESQKTEAQKAAEALSAAQTELAKYKKRDQVAAWAKEIVKDSPIPADALRGDTEEDLRAHFDQLKSLIPTEKARKGALGPYVPQEGAQPGGPLGGSDWLRDSIRH